MQIRESLRTEGKVFRDHMAGKLIQNKGAAYQTTSVHQSAIDNFPRGKTYRKTMAKTFDSSGVAGAFRDWNSVEKVREMRELSRENTRLLTNLHAEELRELTKLNV